MIVKNESKVIERCFDAVSSVVDEQVIWDTGSTDGTQEVMKKYWKKHKLKGKCMIDLGFPSATTDRKLLIQVKGEETTL